MHKVLADCPGYDLSVAFSWAVTAWNSLSSFSGFSPNQLVFGQNPGIPGAFYDKLPALENKKFSNSSAEIVMEDLNALHAARRAFTQAESSERLTRALHHNVKESDPGDLRCGDEVYYKSMSSDERRGPGNVIGKDGKQFLVKHGGMVVRVHSCRLTGLSTSVDGDNLNNNTTSTSYDKSGSSVNSATGADYSFVDESNLDSDQEENEVTMLVMFKIV